jgi:hypothetical protein
MIKEILTGIGILLGVGVIVNLQQGQLEQINQETVVSLEQLQKQDEQEKVKLELLRKIPSFGFDNLIADWTFLRFLQYFGDENVRNITGYSLSPEYFDIIINRDPRFLDVHTFLSTSVSIYAGMPQKTVELMEKSLESVLPTQPNAYYVWRNKAIDELLFLGDSQAAQKSFEIAAEWASINSDPESQMVAEVSRNTAEFLRTNPNSIKAQINAWLMVFSHAVDDRVRNLAINKITSLGADVFLDQQGNIQVTFPPED